MVLVREVRLAYSEAPFMSPRVLKPYPIPMTLSNQKGPRATLPVIQRPWTEVGAKSLITVLLGS